MNVTSVTLTYGRKMNLGDFNNSHLDLAIGADVQEGDDLNAVMHDLWACVRENVKQHAMPLLGRSSDPEAAYLGLPSQMDRWQPKGSLLAAPAPQQETCDDSDDEDWLGDIDPDNSLPFGDK